MRQFRVHALATVAVAALALAACGSSSKSSSASDSTTSSPSTAVAPTTTTAAPAADATVKVATTKLGKVMVDNKGLTLYRFDNDTTPGQSTCGAGVCATTWPAATVTGTPTVGVGIDASKLTTFMRADGKNQLQIAGHPLYRFAGDAKAGDTNGQGILDKWYAAGPDGDKVGDSS
jgi:predicted lipoprotein with Yx(FWY)xxD motif